MHDDRFVQRRVFAAPTRDVRELLVEHGTLRRLRRRVVVAIHSEFAPSDAFAVKANAAHLGPIRWFFGIKRMNARARPEVFVCLRECQRAHRVGGGGRDGDRTDDSHCTRIGQDLIDAPFVLGKGEMAMGIDHARHGIGTRAECRTA